ncbi:MAG: methyltransferase [Flavobacteriales bacterium CG_4_8_14_3_um_filter_35_10]|nr:MAG: hypothetical protein AUJ53_10950 [Flavobacteriaceae bacterium CG1_02_35_72]PIX05908.1 MAG: methyltransferase [Flavobacteriales bacterium CG_4_8_14_3_um_filter_35_10]
MFYQVISYLKFLLKSTDKHGIHSPFVFDFTANCLDIKLNKTEGIYLGYQSYKSSLLADKTFINITDFGAGSKYFKSNQRQISEIAKYAGISNKKAKLLTKILNYFKPTNILELGTSLGLSSLILSQQNRAKVITIEGCKATSNFAQTHLTALELNSVRFISDEFSKVLPQLTKEHQFDLVYFDGNHQKEATLNYFNQCLKTIHNETIFIFDDIHLSKAMYESWQELIKNPKITVSIDLFYFGIAFFRTEQTKQHFYIRTNS